MNYLKKFQVLVVKFRVQFMFQKNQKMIATIRIKKWFLNLMILNIKGSFLALRIEGDKYQLMKELKVLTMIELKI